MPIRRGEERRRHYGYSLVVMFYDLGDRLMLSPENFWIWDEDEGVIQDENRETVEWWGIAV